MNKICKLCGKSKSVFSFQRKKKKTSEPAKEWIPRIDTCSDCLREAAIKREKEIPLEKWMQKHVRSCKRRTFERSEGLSVENIDNVVLTDVFLEQKGKCKLCGVDLRLSSIPEEGYGLCREDREQLGIVENYAPDDLVSVDRIDSGDPNEPYCSDPEDDSTFNFQLVCWGCNKDKYLESDVLLKLQNRNLELIKENSTLKKEIEELHDAQPLPTFAYSQESKWLLQRCHFLNSILKSTREECDALKRRVEECQKAVPIQPFDDSYLKRKIALPQKKKIKTEPRVLVKIN